MADNIKELKLQRVNYESDFSFVLELLDCEETDLGFPEWDWEAEITAGSKSSVYRVGCHDRQTVNCINDNGRIRVVMQSHGLGCGMLRVKLKEFVPDTLYLGGNRRSVTPRHVAIMLIDGPSECSPEMIATVRLSSLKVKFADLTEEEKAELQSPATEAAKLAEAGELRRMANEQYRYTNEETRKTAEALRQTNEGIRENKVNLWQDAEDARKLAEKRREDNETSRETQEDRRVTEEEYRERAENAREENEVTRQTNETWRKSRFTELAGEMASAATLIETWKGYINQWSTDENTAKSNETARRKAEGERKSAETARVNAEQGRVLAEQSRVAAEEQRALLFSGYETIINSKQDALTTSEDLQISEDNELSLTDMAKKRLFDDMYRTAVRTYGDIDYTHCEDGVSKPYKLNGLWLTYTEAREALARYGDGGWHINGLLHGAQYQGANIPTNIPPRVLYQSQGNITRHGYNNIRIFVCDGSPLISGNFHEFMSNCPNLEEIRNARLNPTSATDWFKNCPKLREIRLDMRQSASFSLQWCPLMSYQTFRYVTHEGSNYLPANSKVTITVHPDVYAKLTGDTTNEAAAALTPEELAQWQQVLADAVAKNISFATL